MFPASQGPSLGEAGFGGLAAGGAQLGNWL